MPVESTPIQMDKKRSISMNSLSNTIDEANDQLSNILESIDNLNSAEEELREFVEKLEEAQSLLEELDGYSVSVDVESFNFDLTFQL